MKRRSSSRQTHFVPKVIFERTFAGVVPVCVAAAGACGGGPAPFVAAIGFEAGPSDGDSGPDASAGPDVFPIGVAAIGFDASAREGSADADAGDGADAQFKIPGVAFAAFSLPGRGKE